MKHLSVFSFLLFSLFFAQAQNPIGMPQIINFPSASYRGGNQNWDIQQDGNGIVYFANNEGLLTYNGQNWKLYSIPSKTVVRSVHIDNKGKIYIGAQDDIGYFYPDQLGILKYFSLKHLIPKKESSFSDVWNIVEFNNQIFFRTNEKIFKLNQKTISTYNSNPGWLFLGKCQNRLFAQERTNQLMEFANDKWNLVCRLPGQALITAIVHYEKDKLLIATLRNGLFLLDGHQLKKLNTPMDKQFSAVRINSALYIDAQRFAIGSAFGGCYIIDHSGNLVQVFSDKQTLQKNNVRSLYLDHDKNIWLGLDDGISFIAYNSSIKQIFPDANKQSSTYAVKMFNKNLFIGTSDAVYKLPVNDSTKDLSYANGVFNEIPKTEGQVWNLNLVNKQLLLGNEDGAYTINQGDVQQIYPFPGTWLFKPLSLNNNTSDVISGTYNGLRLLKYQNNRFLDKGILDGLEESLRFLTVDYEHNTVWASHPYRGVYKISLSANHQQITNSILYNQKYGLPSSLHNYVFKIKGRDIVSTEKGIYQYNAATNKFGLAPYFFPMFKNSEIQYLNEDDDGNIWFIGNKKVGVVDFSKAVPGKPFSIYYFPELTDKVLPGFENIYPYNKQNIFIGSNRGVIHINYQKYLANLQKPNILLGLVKIIGEKDSVIFGGYFNHGGNILAAQDKRAIVTLASRFNSFHFEYSSTLFEQQNNIQFSYQLAGYDTKWSSWSSKSEKEYTNLPYGTYTFMVKSRNNLGNESNSVCYTFIIQPAWYQTPLSYAIYTLMLLGSVYLIVIIQQKKHKKAELNLKYIHQLELEHNEKEIVSLKNEKLKNEVNFKNKELATTTMHLVQRGKLMSKIKEGLMGIQDAPEGAKSAELVKVLKLINEAEKNDSDWDHFAVHFDQVHSDFLATLKNKFPALSGTDLKICAYLKMNLSSKEIAQLMSVTLGAVEVSRYRLRKKLDLPSHVNLFDYLLQATSQTL
ncbi:YXYXY domain-containing protein [Mucilaginibacter gracilis]|uniref:YXYXY domain-containing protein n=1 Tax=Mucilaginibacter gracilis TaxID=423350 RepID=A0A495J6D8_9SPHI|nr:triple tyrosine motif-containing protein [Mucilaginibacter gracilis]RKR84566.1 YXYXY domain-containing protein [Mucilaginibacter gracilis]